jgi:hypothetical protein
MSCPHLAQTRPTILLPHLGQLRATSSALKPQFGQNFPSWMNPQPSHFTWESTAPHDGHFPTIIA